MYVGIATREVRHRDEWPELHRQCIGRRQQSIGFIQGLAALSFANVKHAEPLRGTTVLDSVRSTLGSRVGTRRIAVVVEERPRNRP